MSEVIDNEPTTDNVESEQETIITDEMLDSMSDNEFENYLNNGVLPDRFITDSNSNTVDDTDNTNEDVEDTTVEEEETTDTTTTEEETNSTTDTVEDITDTSDTDSNSTINYEEAYKKIFDTPIKADGTEIRLKSVDELISLAQKGVNYTRKTQELAKDRKLVQSLKEANINEQDLNVLIDVFKGNSKAIKSVIEKHKIDLDEYNTDEDNENSKYTPSNNIVSDVEIAMIDVVNDIKNSPYKEDISRVMSVWDKDSVDILMQQPQLLKGLLEEFELGRFEKTQQILAYEKQFDNANIPDIQRYANILNKNTVDTNKQTQQTKQQSKPKVKVEAGSKKSASIQSNTSNVTKSTLSDEELDKLSDEEFLKLFK